VTAAIRAVEAAGHVVKRIEIEQDGKIAIILETRSSGELLPDQPEPNEWDEVFDENSA
jgi:hypothetical protein